MPFAFASASSDAGSISAVSAFQRGPVVSPLKVKRREDANAGDVCEATCGPWHTRSARVPAVASLAGSVVWPDWPQYVGYSSYPQLTLHFSGAGANTSKGWCLMGWMTGDAGRQAWTAWGNPHTKERRLRKDPKSTCVLCPDRLQPS
jgi:hypothetical protein